jgi:hypothetical protein
MTNTLTREEILQIANAAFRDVQLAPNTEVAYMIATQAMNVLADTIPDEPPERWLRPAHQP